MPETPSSEGPVPEGIESVEAAKPRPALVLRGTPVAPGLALGRVHRKDYDLLRAHVERVPLEGVERELNRFHQALVDVRGQLARLKQSLTGKVSVDDARILDVHVAYLKDTVFISDVEDLILNEQMTLEAAIGKVISNFDRIFRLVQNQSLRDRAVDLRDVGIRILRHLESRVQAEMPEAERTPSDYILVARELTIVDMFNLAGRHVLGILAESGGLTSHAAILARSMRIPTLTGIERLLETVNEGDFVILDASEGSARVNPDEVVIAQYRESVSRSNESTHADEAEDLGLSPPRTRDGEVVHVRASCGNLPEVTQAFQQGLRAIGLYRTELLYLIEKEQPSLEALTRHYTAVIEEARGGSVTFRLLHADSSAEIGYLHEKRELNPALGRSGVRALLSREQVLRRQLQAILSAGTAADVRVAIPFVIDCGELRRVKEILFEEKLELRKRGTALLESLAVGVILETPAALLGVRDLAREADFLVVSLDGLQQHLLAADRENASLSSYFETLHPFVIRALHKVADVAHANGKPLSVFGVTAAEPRNLPFLLGLGLRDFCLAPSVQPAFLEELARIDLKAARRSAAAAASAACMAETHTLVDRFRHGLVRG